MSEYKITRISQDPPREWANPKGGTVYYRKVMLEGWEKPVSVGKKSADALHLGDVLQGTITPDPEHGEDKFKADPIAYGGGAGKPAYQPKDEEAIARAVALKAAVETVANADVKVTDDVLKLADTYLAWLQYRPEVPKDDPTEPRYVDNRADDGF